MRLGYQVPLFFGRPLPAEFSVETGEEARERKGIEVDSRSSELTAAAAKDAGAADAPPLRHPVPARRVDEVTGLTPEEEEELRPPDRRVVAEQPAHGVGGPRRARRAHQPTPRHAADGHRAGRRSPAHRRRHRVHARQRSVLAVRAGGPRQARAGVGVVVPRGRDLERRSGARSAARPRGPLHCRRSVLGARLRDQRAGADLPRRTTASRSAGEAS